MGLACGRRAGQIDVGRTRHDLSKAPRRLVRERDRTELLLRGATDTFPTGTAFTDFVAPTGVVFLEGGKFHPEHDQIDIYREGAPPSPRGRPSDAAEASPRPMVELVWLAHELGHLESRERGRHRPLTPEPEPMATYLEELRAWGYARPLLEKLGFDQWPQFERLMGQGLESYRKGLGLTASDVGAAEKIALRELIAEARSKHAEVPE
jgi:hypothetical protein